MSTMQPITGTATGGTIRAVLFDYSGTLFHLKRGEHLLGPVLAQMHPRPPATEIKALVDRLTRARAGTLPTPPAPAEILYAYQGRHLDPWLHRRAYTWWLRTTGPMRLELADQIYDRVVDPHAWQPYPDTDAALRRVKAAGRPIAVLSNITFDIRPAFAHHHLETLVDQMVLSFEERLAKPDPAVFHIACDRLGIAPSETVMIGNNPDEDGGILDIGGRYIGVDRLTNRRRALLAAVTAALGEA
ncbi:MAG: HAD family hydrolase [Actinomycetota bacterium]|nr:HAD family hydrolase [Actinomycetota bacterium]